MPDSELLPSSRCRRDLKTRLLILLLCAGSLLVLTGATRERPIRIAVLSFGTTHTAALVARAIREPFAVLSTQAEFAVIDSDLAAIAARGAGYDGSLNLSVSEARDLGSAIGTDFYFIVLADTVKRSPSTGAPYYESYASVFLVSARTGRLVFWERPLERADSPRAAENSLLRILASDETQRRYQTAVKRTVAAERTQRAQAVTAPPQFIEVMSDDVTDSDKQLRAPRPFRRLKPLYPQSAAVAEVEAVVDVLVDVDAHGEVVHIEIARWAGYGLDESVINTVKQMQFFPAMRDGAAIPTRVLLRYNFRKPPPNLPSP